MFCYDYSGNFPSPRIEQLINIDNHPAVGLRGAERPGSPFDVRIMGAIRVGQWKLITGNPGKQPTACKKQLSLLYTHT